MFWGIEFAAKKLNLACLVVKENELRSGTSQETVFSKLAGNCK